MFFNPLFISSANSVNNNGSSSKEEKFTNSNYLFANIINVSKEKLSSLEQNIKIDEKNKALFTNLKIGTQSGESSKLDENKFTTDVSKLSTFLSNIFERKISTLKDENSNVDKNITSDLSEIPEQIVNVLNAINSGEKISIPIINAGKNIFVEVQKADTETSSKVIKLASKEISELKFSDLDLDRIISDISSVLSKVLPQINSEFNKEKLNAVVGEIKNGFTNLVTVKSDSFQPQTNVLGQLINKIEKSFDLSASESNAIKNVIVSEFVKQIKQTIDIKTNEDSNNKNEGLLVSVNSLVYELNLSPKDASTGQNLELKSIMNKIDNSLEFINATQHNEKMKLSALISKLDLTTNEAEALNKIVVNKTSFSDLSKDIKAEVLKANSSLEFRSIFQKLNKYQGGNKLGKLESVSEKLPLKEIVNKLNLTTKEVEALNKIAVNKISFSDLSEVIKTENAKANSSLELNSIVQKLNKFKTLNKIENTENLSEKLSLKEISTKLNLNPKEVKVLSGKLSGKISLAEVSKKIEPELQSKSTGVELKSVEQKVEKYIATEETKIKSLTFNDLSKSLKLTSTETAVLKKMGVEQIDLKELKLSLTTKIINTPSNPELKSLLAKIAKSNSIGDPNSINSNNIELDANKINQTTKTKVGNKVNIENEKSLKVTDFSKPSVSDENFKYLISLKTAKSSGSILLDSNLKSKIKKPELLKASIYASKETSELTKLKVIPINEEISKSEKINKNDNIKKSVAQKDSVSDIKSIETSKSEGNTGSEQKFSNSNNQYLNLKNDLSHDVNTDKYSQKSFTQEIKNSEGKIVKENNFTVKQSNETKTNEVVFPKSTFVGHQIRNQSLAISEKVIYQHVDIKNIKEEISKLMQQGEKKTVEFQLTPENLGKLQVKLEIINKVVSASIKVDNEMTQQIVQQSMDGLKSSLNQNGVLYNSLNVSLSDTEDKNNRYFKQKRKNSNEFGGNVKDVEEQFVQKKLGYNKYDFIA